MRLKYEALKMTDDKKKKIDPFDPAQFRAPNTLDGSGDGIRREFTQIRIGKPKKSSFFRSHADLTYRLPVNIIEYDSGMMKEEFLVMPTVAEALVEETKPKLLVLCVDKMGTPFLWPAPRQAEDGFQRTNIWNTSALEALRLSETKWVRMSSNMAEGAYTIHTSSSDSEPDWPDLPLSELIKLGFGEERVIRDMNHPVVKRLLGRD
jgi:hypothetical protein